MSAFRIQLSADNSRHTAIQAAIERARTFREDLYVCGAADVFHLDFEQRVILFISDVGQRVENSLFSNRVPVDCQEEISFVI
jgi:hypothetical protein